MSSVSITESRAADISGLLGWPHVGRPAPNPPVTGRGVPHCTFRFFALPCKSLEFVAWGSEVVTL